MPNIIETNARDEGVHVDDALCANANPFGGFGTMKYPRSSCKYTYNKLLEAGWIRLQYIQNEFGSLILWKQLVE